MKVSGSHTLRGSRQEVWDALQDPAVLVRTIPGCHELKEVDDDAYTATVKAGVASIQGTYDGRVSLRDQDPPNSYQLRAEGAGGPGTIDATATVTLAEGQGPDETTASYEAEAIVGGSIAGVGQRVLAGVAKRNAAQFFDAVDAYLQGELPDESDADEAGDGAVAATDAETGEKTFRAPAAASGGGGGTGPVHLVLATVVGAAIALAGVALGGRLRRG